MFKTLLRASLLLAPVVVAQAATPAADLDELHQRQFRYARAMMQLNQLEGFERGPSIEALLQQEREAKAKRADERLRDARRFIADSLDSLPVATLVSDNAEQVLFGSWMLPFPGLEQEPIDCADIPTLDIEFGSQHWAAEHTAAPISLTNAVAQRWPLLTATDTHAPEPPGYDFTAYQDAVNPKQYPTTTKRRKK